MKYTDTVIIGGGQAGLAMSRCLWECGVKHVVHGAGLPRQPQPRRPGELWLLDHDLHTPASLSQEGRYGLGAQASEARLREVLTHSGFGIVRRAAETPFNLILEARP